MLKFILLLVIILLFILKFTASQSRTKDNSSVNFIAFLNRKKKKYTENMLIINPSNKLYKSPVDLQINFDEWEKMGPKSLARKLLKMKKKNYKK